mmetsp:Transcript_33847/g.57484  ORF Transcript_33847/g.57484 Transcript_33847/m.57484 type:complete len:91 (-) Transcript_33847:4-276(-)
MAAKEGFAAYAPIRLTSSENWGPVAGRDKNIYFQVELTLVPTASRVDAPHPRNRCNRCSTPILLESLYNQMSNILLPILNPFVNSWFRWR